MYDFARDQAMLDEDLDEYRLFYDPPEDPLLEERVADLHNAIGVTQTLLCILIVGVFYLIWSL